VTACGGRHGHKEFLPEETLITIENTLFIIDKEDSVSQEISSQVNL
jgi:hypothetical protein